jgi:hypothetical protein
MKRAPIPSGAFSHEGNNSRASEEKNLVRNKNSCYLHMEKHEDIARYRAGIGLMEKLNPELEKLNPELLKLFLDMEKLAEKSCFPGTRHCVLHNHIQVNFLTLKNNGAFIPILEHHYDNVCEKWCVFSDEGKCELGTLYNRIKEFRKNPERYLKKPTESENRFDDLELV